MIHLRRDVGIDLGTASVLVYVRGKGIVLREPSVVAVDRETGKPVKVGAEAQRMLGRTPENLTALRPLRDGVISDYDMTERMLRSYLERALPFHVLKPRLVICIPSGATQVEERAVIDAGMQAGAKKVYLIEEPLAAALGAGLKISGATGHLLVDIGGGTADVGVISLSGVVWSASVPAAGDRFTEAIIRYVRKKHGVLLGERTADELKIRIGCVYPQEEAQSLTVKGRALATGLPQEVTVTDRETLEAFREPAARVLETVRGVLERTPPELVGDISENGITMTGGGSLLRGFPRLIQEATGIETRLAEDPIACVARGTGRALESLKKMRAGSLQLERKRKLRQGEP